jgi:hypothetical protein
MKRFLVRLAAAIVLTMPIGWVLGSQDWFWSLVKSPIGHHILDWASKPFEPLDGESYDNPVVVVMLLLSFIIASVVVWGGSAVFHLNRRSTR